MARKNERNNQHNGGKYLNVIKRNCKSRKLGDKVTTPTEKGEQRKCQISIEKHRKQKQASVVVITQLAKFGARGVLWLYVVTYVCVCVSACVCLQCKLYISSFIPLAHSG